MSFLLYRVLFKLASVPVIVDGTSCAGKRSRPVRIKKLPRHLAGRINNDSRNNINVHEISSTQPQNDCNAQTPVRVRTMIAQPL